RNITVTLKEQNNKKIITVQDNAGGIPEHIIDKIFDAHITTKEAANGTGIGLYMSSQIIQKIGANISVENKENGACFTIEI
ncbi:MAG: HAMP domain-containing sensor histidine kinase, partial [Campylobacterota bacterium]|nr:HAMP domain-containing sensor histidine kinase [Campylobacterota bacterium]